MISIALQVRQQTKSERVLEVHSFNGDQVPRYFRGALTESNPMVVHGELLRVICKRAKTFRLKAAQVLHRHLKNLGFFQFGRRLFLEGRWYQSTELIKTIVDAIPAFFLDCLRK